MIRHTKFTLLLNIFIASTHKIKLYTIEIREITKVKHKAICINNEKIFVKKGLKIVKFGTVRSTRYYIYLKKGQNAIRTNMDGIIMKIR